MRPPFVSDALARGLGLVAVVALLAGGAGAARAGSHDLEHRLSDARVNAAAASAREQAIAGEIAARSDEIDAVETQIGVLRGEVAVLELELARSRALLDEVERELAEKTRTLTRARREIGAAQRLLSRRLVELYTSDEPDVISVAIGAASLDELVDVLETRSRVLDAEADLVGEVTALRERVTRERARAAALRKQRAAQTGAIERRTNARRAAMATLVARRDALAELRSARERSLAAVRVDRNEWEAEANALAAESARVASVLASSASVASAGSTESPAPTPTPSTGFVWPVRGSVVSPFGQRWGRLHSGLDIAAPAGTPIAASASGQVVFAGSMSGYGLLVVVQHAGGIATAYAHNSSISVSVGQLVGQGQTIAAVGCTGRCFGDHVHFEVRVGGSPVDPMGYL